MGEDQDEPLRKRKAGGMAMGETQGRRLDHRARGGRLSAADRQALPSKDFALPGKGEGPKGAGSGSYPIPDRGHGVAALSMVSRFGTQAEKARVTQAVHKKFPDLDGG